MLPAANRLRRSADFSTVVRQGSRARGGALVVHRLLDQGGGTSDPAPLVGLVVGKSVGNSVTRHRVSRRLRAQLNARVPNLAPRSRIVVRALPAAATADSLQLGADLDRALRRLSGVR